MDKGIEVLKHIGKERFESTVIEISDLFAKNKLSFIEGSAVMLIVLFENLKKVGQVNPEQAEFVENMFLEFGEAIFEQELEEQNENNND